MSAAKQLFSEQDRNLIQSQVYDASLNPGFNALSACLTWADENPWGLSREGIDVLGNLWIVRSLMHRGLTFDDDPFDPELCRRIWQQATEEIPDWPGFKRLVLNEKDRAYFEEYLAKENPFD